MRQGCGCLDAVLGFRFVQQFLALYRKNGRGDCVGVEEGLGKCSKPPAPLPLCSHGFSMPNPLAALVAWRNRRATIVRILAPLVFLLLALLIDRSIQAVNSNKSAFTNLENPTVEPLNAIPQCKDDLYIGRSSGCKEVLYSPSPNAAADVGAVGWRGGGGLHNALHGHARMHIAWGGACLRE